MFNNLKSNCVSDINYELINKLNKFSFKRITRTIDIEIDKKSLKASRKNAEIFKQIMILFLNTMIDNCKNFDFEKFNENFKITIFTIKNKEKTKNVSGIVGRRIYELLGKKYTHLYYRIDSFKIATHELFHLSTPGFRDLNDSFRGQGLNEGYTELLNRRYFNIQFDNPYIIETKIAQLLEKILGTDVMEKAYFEANFDLIINELSIYMDLKDINEFRDNIDCINRLKLDIYDKDFRIKKEKVQNYTNLVYKFLFQLFIKKIGALDSNDYEDFISEFSYDDFCDVAQYNLSDGSSYFINSFDSNDKDGLYYYNYVNDILNNSNKKTK